MQNGTWTVVLRHSTTVRTLAIVRIVIFSVLGGLLLLIDLGLGFAAVHGDRGHVSVAVVIFGLLILVMAWGVVRVAFWGLRPATLHFDGVALHARIGFSTRVIPFGELAPAVLADVLVGIQQSTATLLLLPRADGTRIAAFSTLVWRIEDVFALANLIRPFDMRPEGFQPMATMRVRFPRAIRFSEARPGAMLGIGLGLIFGIPIVLGIVAAVIIPVVAAVTSAP